MRAQLVPLRGGTPIQITRDVTVVGRTQEICDVCIDRSSVSKLHCIIVRTDGLLFVRDLGSTNGTKVNGQKVLRGALLPGDELAFASERFRVEMGPDKPKRVDVHNELTEAISAFDLQQHLAQAQAQQAQPRPGIRRSDDPDSSASDVRMLTEEER